MASFLKILKYKSKFIKVMRRLTTILFFLILTQHVISQAPQWETSFKTAINWQKLTPYGTLIVSTSDGIKGIDPKTGNVLWTSKPSLGAAPESSFQMIDQTPFFSVQVGNGSNEDYCIIESFEGVQVFSSYDMGLQKVNSQYLLQLSGAILVLGTESISNNPATYMIDINTGQKLWFKESNYGIITACKDLGNNECIITTGLFVIKLNVRTGQEIWRKVLDPRFEGMSDLMTAFDKGTANYFDFSKVNAAIATSQYYKDGFYVSVQTMKQKKSTDSKGVTTTENYIERNYMGFNINTGEYLWPSVKNLQGPVGVVFASEQGLVVAVGEYPKGIPNLVQAMGTDIHCYDYATGESKWGKKGNGINLKGGVLRTITPIDGKFLLVSGKDNNFLDLVDPRTGLSTVEKEIKVNGQVEYISNTELGILYATNDEVNIINFTEGKKIFDKSFKSNSSLMYENEESVVLFNLKDKMLYEIDLKSGSSKTISPEIEWEGKDQAKTIEKRPEGYLISSDQNLVLVNDGAIVYNKYFVAPVDNGWKKALYYANAIFSAYASIVYSANAGLYGSVSQSIKVNDASSQLAKDITNQISDMYGDAAKSSMKYAGKMIDQANKRYKATKTTNDYCFILTVVDKKTAQLVRVDKKTGEIVNTIPLDKDKTPVYEIDGIENRIFYKSSSTMIQQYSF